VDTIADEAEEAPSSLRVSFFFLNAVPQAWLPSFPVVFGSLFSFFFPSCVTLTSTLTREEVACELTHFLAEL
jgi:hypothetical protein